ncbi:TetR/AcrR family transcriptional regulator [Amycolatopsis nigrescens]|uniref:TetR/AcrR family transcriptional regulator n=1 Tax=Amycolatopsis nigrescens TaxID=381445 RepID=UPI00036174C7|nr:TetR/AcrR family transcriptional regulator [Amycolatopsis nigrescens]
MADTDDGSAGERPDLLWELEDRQAKPVRPALTVARIADAAIELADADGMAAVSMQQVAGRLDVTKMALYRHVANKAELVAVMTESAIGAPPDLRKVPGSWRSRLQEWARQMRETWQRHPWLPEATVGQRPTGPREIGWTESAVAALDGTGLHGSERMDAVFLLSGHLRNTHSVAMAGTQPWTAERGLKPLVEAHADRFPALVAAGSTAKPSEDNGWEFGLHRILDGLALLIERRPSRE